MSNNLERKTIEYILNEMNNIGEQEHIADPVVLSNQLKNNINLLVSKINDNREEFNDFNLNQFLLILDKNFSYFINIFNKTNSEIKKLEEENQKLSLENNELNILYNEFINQKKETETSNNISLSEELEKFKKIVCELNEKCQKLSNENNQQIKTISLLNNNVAELFKMNQDYEKKFKEIKNNNDKKEERQELNIKNLNERINELIKINEKIIKKSDNQEKDVIELKKNIKDLKEKNDSQERDIKELKNKNKLLEEGKKEQDSLFTKFSLDISALKLKLKNIQNRDNYISIIYIILIYYNFNFKDIGGNITQFINKFKDKEFNFLNNLYEKYKEGNADAHDSFDQEFINKLLSGTNYKNKISIEIHNKTKNILRRCHYYNISNTKYTPELEKDIEDLTKSIKNLNLDKFKSN